MRIADLAAVAPRDLLSPHARVAVALHVFAGEQICAICVAKVASLGYGINVLVPQVEPRIPQVDVPGSLDCAP